MKKLNPHHFLLYTCITFVGVLLITIPSFASLTPQYTFMEQPIPRRVKAQKELTPEQVKQQVQARMQLVRDDFQEETFDERKEAMTQLIAQEQSLLLQGEEMLASDKPVSALTADTKTELQTTIDSLQSQLDDMQKKVSEAEEVETLYDIHIDMVQWLYTNKSALKTLGIDVYTESLRGVVSADQIAVAEAKVELVKYTVKQLDTITFKQLITEADTTVTTADTQVDVAAANPTLTTLIPATEATILGTMDLLEMLEEGDALEEQQ